MLFRSFSAEDLSNAMLGQPVWGIFGYSTRSARQLMTNILLYAKKMHPAKGEDDKAEENKKAKEQQNAAPKSADAKTPKKTDAKADAKTGTKMK